MNLTKNFTVKEMACSCCGESKMDVRFMDMLQALRSVLDRPLVVASAYRCPEYNNKVSSTGTDGPHTTGKAVDIGISRADAVDLLEKALMIGFTGIGIQQKGTGRFIHLDTLDKRMWSY